MDPASPTVCLLSGGIESTTLLHRLARRGQVAPLFIDYGQRAAAQEWRAASWQCARLGLEPVRLDMAAVGEAFRAGQSQRFHVPLPHRNLVALSLGLSYGSQIGAARIAIALNRDDLHAYPSAAPGFLQAFGDMAASLEPIELVTPLAALSKAQVVAEGIALGVDFAQTYSCLLGHALHCGRCPQCEKRRAAFAAVGSPEADTAYRG